MQADLEVLEQALGYRFTERELLIRALTHSSVSNEIHPPAPKPALKKDNERLEFLGDSILGWLVGEWLYLRFDIFTEGQLSLLKNHVVSAAHLLSAAERLELGKYLRLGKGEESAGGRSKQRLLANAVEAVLAAIYLDGGSAPAKEFVLRFAIPEEGRLLELADATPPSDFRAELDRLCRERNLAAPQYIILGETGPGHARIFQAEVRLGGQVTAHGAGSSKKAASHEAARSACEMLKTAE